MRKILPTKKKLIPKSLIPKVRKLRFPLFFVFQQANSFMLSAYVSVE